MSKKYSYICPTCGIEFFSQVIPNRKKSPVYCSKNCYSIGRIKCSDKYPCKCVYCGNDFYGTNEDTRFCSMQCYGKWRRAGEYRICKNCGQEFYSRVSHSNQFCDRKCYDEYRVKNAVKICKGCGKEYKTSIDFQNRYYCSRECWRSRPQTGITKLCLNCNNEFYICQSHKVNTLFCSRKCRYEYKGPSSIEKLLAKEMDKRGIEYIPQFKIGRFFADFAIISQKVIVEADGTYWHSLPENSARDKRKDKYVTQHGWSIIRFSESEIKSSPSNCIDTLVRLIK